MKKLALLGIGVLLVSNFEFPTVGNGSSHITIQSIVDKYCFGGIVCTSNAERGIEKGWPIQKIIMAMGSGALEDANHDSIKAALVMEQAVKKALQLSDDSFLIGQEMVFVNPKDKKGIRKVRSRFRAALTN